jgi:tripartite-type tricarboxylate transporter receptor subunit TctC
VIAVHPAVKASTLGELVALSKSGQQTLTISNPGNGTIGHLATEALRLQGGARLRSIPYKGDAPAMTDAISGTVDGVSAPVTSLIANIQGHKLKALAVTSQTRFPGLPDVPTAAEQGIALQATVWNAVVGPAGLPPAIVNALNQEINRFTTSAEGKARLAALGVLPLAGTPAQLGELMATESARWQKVVEAAKISLQ